MTKRSGRSCARGIDLELAKRRTPHGSGLGVFRWVVERTMSWLHQFRRLRVGYDRRDDIHQWLYDMAEVLITFRFLELYSAIYSALIHISF
jgi:hypothetical protein